MTLKGVYGQSPLEDSWRVARAAATNQLARFLPATYVRLTGETGRGRDVVSPSVTANYFLTCVHEYLDLLEVPHSGGSAYWRGKSIVEYGPGDIPGVALLLAGFGASRVTCVDRFPLVRFDDYQQAVIAELEQLLPDDACRDRMRSCFRNAGDPTQGLSDGPVQYVVSRSGLLGKSGVADMVMSRAVLEHVDDLPATFDDMAEVLVPDGLAIHLVDLKSHGLHRNNRLDFLTWPEGIWRLMFSHKGAPNRHRINMYRELAPRGGLRIEKIQPCETAGSDEVAEIRPHLARPFRDLPDADLSSLSFWLVARRPAS